MALQPLQRDELIRSLWGRPMLVLVLSIAIGGLLWVVEEKNHRTQYRLELEVTAEQSGKRLSDWAEDRMNLSRFLAERWDDEYVDDLYRYTQDAAEFVERFPGFKALNWMDSAGVIRVVVPMEGNESVLNVDLSKSAFPEVRNALLRAKESGRPTRTPAFINLIQGGRGFATYFPVFDGEGNHTGFINAVFRVNEFVETCLARIQGVDEFRLALREDNGVLVYPIDAEEDYLQTEEAISVAVNVIDQTWELSLAPAPALIHARTFDPHHLILPFAIGVGLLLAALERILAQRNRALLLSQAQYHKLFQDAPIGYFSVKPDGIIEKVNRVAAALTGCSREAISGKDIFDFFPDDGNVRDTVRQQFEQVRNGEPIRVEETQMLRENGPPFWVMASVEGVYNADQALTLFRLTIRDVSERKEAEEARSCLAAAVEQAEEGFVITSASGTIQYVNPAFNESGIGAEGSLTQQRLGDVFQAAGVPEHVVAPLREAIDRGQRWQGTYALSRGRGKTKRAVATLSPLRDDSGKLSTFVLLQRDVTHEDELQSQLLQARKMEAIGRLAGGIAHDFNNILQSLLGYASLGRKQREDPVAVEHCLIEIERAGNRAAELIAQILAFGRRTDEPDQLLWLREIINEVRDLLQGALPENINFDVSTESPQYPIVGDATQIHQILMNLASNAQHAMSDSGGLLKIDSRAVTVSEGGTDNLEGLAPGEYMCLSVEDSGAGMSDEIRQRVFEPYFTTREGGQGSGLGLAMVHGLVNQHGGTVQVESAPGEGTTFLIYFPVVHHGKTETVTDLKTDGGGAMDHQEPSPNKLRVLYVDDEVQIVDSMSRLLIHAGFEVVGHASSVDALACFQGNPEAFDVLVTDLSMPDMNGIDLAKAIHSQRSNLPVILCSGYSDTFDSEIEDNRQTIKTYLVKPVTAATLRAAIEDACVRKA